MSHRAQLWLLLCCSLHAWVGCGDTVEGACENDQNCPAGKVCGSDGQCASKTTYRPPRPVEDGGGVPPTADAGMDVGLDGGTGTSTRPAGLVPSGNPEWTIVLNGNTWVLTEFSEFMMQPDVGSCFFIGYKLDRARSEGPVSGGEDGPTEVHSGWSQWYGLGNYAYSSQCPSDYSAELTLGRVRYVLTGTLMKTISLSASGSGGPAVIGTWSDGTRGGRFELYDYVR